MLPVRGRLGEEMQYNYAQKQILERMPHFIAVNYKTMLDALGDEARVEAGLTTFDRCLRLLTIILTSQYLIRDRESISDPYLNRLLAERFPLGDLRSWCDVFLTALKAYEGHSEWLFVPEMYKLYWDTSDPERHRPRLEIEQVLDRLIALSSDRQDRKNMPTDAEGWAGLANEVSTRMEYILEHLAFLANYELVCITESLGARYTAKRYVGLDITTVTLEYGDELLQPNWYYLNRSRCDFLLLDPLLMPWHAKQGETAIFYRLTAYNRLRYLLALTGKLLTDTTRLEDFIALMETIEQVKQVIRKKEELTWLQVTATAADITTSRMATVSGRFDKDVYLQRRDALNQFKEFMASEKRCFVLTGKSGAGKSAFVLSLLDEYEAEPDLCLLMLDAPQIDTNLGLSAFIGEEFRLHWGLRRGDLPEIWEEIDRLPGMDHRTVLLVLDAINENVRQRELLRQVNELLQQPWRWLKILIVSRPETWRRMCFGQHLAEYFFFQSSSRADTQVGDVPRLSAYDMEPFKWDELRAAYERYREEFSLETSYDELSPEIRQLIREPLQLWVVANTFQGQAVPKRLPPGRLIEDYIGALLETERLYPEDIRLLQRELVPLMEPEPGQYTNAITPAVLEDAGGNLLERVFSEGYYSTGEPVNEPFQRLADAQIIVLRMQGLHSVLRFGHERFYDYFVGKFLFEHHLKPAADITETSRWLIDCIKETPFLYGAVEHALYLALGYAPDTIKQLAITDSLNISFLISTILQSYAKADSQTVSNLIGQIVSLSTTKRRKVPRTQRLRATEVALQVAATLDDKETFIQVLLCDEATIRDAGIKHAYYLSKRKPFQTLEILQRVSEEITKPLVTFDVPALQSTVRLALLLLLDCYQGGELVSPIVDDLVATVRDAFSRISSKAAFRFVGGAARTWIARATIQLLVEILRRNESISSINNLHEYSLFFRQPETLRCRAREALSYLADRASSLSDISDLIVRLYRTCDRVSEQIADYIVISYGIHAPSEAEPVLRQVLDEVNDPGGGIEAFVAFSWHAIIARQPTISAAELATMKTFVSRFLDSKHGYGAFKRHGRLYRYHPLNYYIDSWTRVHPGDQVDLLQMYLDRAVATDDQELLIHIIDSFGDLRELVQDYHIPLRVLVPCVRKPDPIREHLVRNLGSLRSLHPSPVENFLVASDAPRDLVTDIRSYSYQKPSSILYARFAHLLLDLVVYAPSEFSREIIGIVDKALRARSFNHMAVVLIDQFLRAFANEA